MKEYRYESCDWLHDDPEFLNFCADKKMNYTHISILAIIMYIIAMYLEKKYCKRRKW
jgi:hypothetical protein